MAAGDVNLIIGNGLEQYNIKDRFMFHLVGQTILNDKPKQRETIAYIEKDGEYTAPPIIDGGMISSNSINDWRNKQPSEPFDYTLDFIYFNKTNYDFERRITDFIKFLNANPNSNLIIQNEYTNNKIIGYYKGYQVNSYDRKKYNNTKDYIEFKVTFRVPKPSFCNFKSVM